MATDGSAIEYAVDEFISEDRPVAADREQSVVATSPTNGLDAPKASTAPPRRPSRLIVWLMLLVCLILAAGPLLVDVNRPDVVNPEEAASLNVAVYTWKHHQQTAAAGARGDRLIDWMEMHPLVPYLNASPQLHDPPGGVWAQQLAFVGLDPKDDPPPRAFVLRGRVASVCFALLTVLAVFWTGASIGPVRTATLAALVCCANPVFIYHARMATPAVQHAALTILSVAAAMWAIRPLRAAASVERQFIGWVVSGIALGAAILTGGLWTGFYVAGPVLIILVLCPGRISHLLGLLASLLIGVLLVMPWLVKAGEADAAVYEQWLSSLRPTDWSDFATLAKQSGVRIGVLLIAMLPWTLWLFGAVIQPFSSSSAGSRIRLLLGWSWFIASILLVTLNPRNVRLADQLVMMPAGAIMVGQLFRQYSDLAAAGRFARFWRFLRWLHLLLLTLTSIAVVAGLYLQPKFVDYGWITQPLLQPPPWYFGVGLGVVLLGIVALSLRWCMRNFPFAAAFGWAVWTLVLVGLLAIPFSRGPAVQSTIAVDAATLRQVAQNQPIYQLDALLEDRPVDARLLFYTNRPVTTVNQTELDQLREQPAAFIVITPLSETPPFEGATRLNPLPSLKLLAWRFTGP